MDNKELNKSLEALELRERSNIDYNKTVYQSGYCGMLAPLEIIEVLPGDKVDLSAIYEIELARCNGLVRSNMVSDITYVYVPYDQIHTNFNSGLYTTTGHGANHPYLNYDMQGNTDATRLHYYLLPQSTAPRYMDISMMPYRAYQKAWYDLYSEAVARHTPITPTDYYRTTDGNDTSTTTFLRGVPTNQKFFNRLMTSLSTSGSVSAPFTVRDLQTAIVNERSYILKKKFGNKIHDLIAKIFNVKNVPSDAVIPIARHVSNLPDMTVLTTDSTTPSVPISRFYGISSGSPVQYTTNWYGLILVLGTVYPADFAIKQGVNPLLDNDYKKDAYGYYRPEAQGLAYKTLLKRNFDIEQTPTDTFGSESVFEHLRETYNESKGHFSRTASLAGQVVNFTGGSVSDYLYYTTSTFTTLFAENPQVRFKLRLKGTINRQIKKYIDMANL